MKLETAKRLVKYTNDIYFLKLIDEIGESEVIEIFSCLNKNGKGEIPQNIIEHFVKVYFKQLDDKIALRKLIDESAFINILKSVDENSFDRLINGFNIINIKTNVQIIINLMQKYGAEYLNISDLILKHNQ